MASSSDFLNLKSYLPPEDNSSSDDESDDDIKDKVPLYSIHCARNYIFLYVHYFFPLDR